MGFLTFLGSFIGGFFGVGSSFLSDGDFALLLTSVWTFLSVFSAESFLSISSFELNDCPASGPRWQ
jgi:hypothetical protein